MTRMKGPRWRIPTPGQNAKRAVFGALHAHTGRLHYLIRPRKRAVEVIVFLDRLVAAYPTGELRRFLRENSRWER